MVTLSSLDVMGGIFDASSRIVSWQKEEEHRNGDSLSSPPARRLRCAFRFLVHDRVVVERRAPRHKRKCPRPRGCS
jgi:hypothetical protein